MASAFSHAFAGVAIGKAMEGRPRSWRFWLLVAGSAAFPDADVLAFFFGIPYENMFGHRGFTHSLLFAACWAWLVMRWDLKDVPRYTSEWWRLAVLFFLVTASHGFLDAFTNGGLGVGFFIPFDSARYFFPWMPIEVSPIGVKAFFTHRGWVVIQSELKYVWIPFGALWIGAWGARRAFNNPGRLKDS